MKSNNKVKLSKEVRERLNDPDIPKRVKSAMLSGDSYRAYQLLTAMKS